ncbi:response regulator [Labrenzia sp. 011]|uniref:response regulator n=1 Tax=Labrenzia sp. 011 TaxID=2171494 RepID=UPI000D524644|nr:response regulator [Labrenzia sp. 011]PVB59326.1 hypothetical protein DCO57_22805 [Labrenzia sp. 011]
MLKALYVDDDEDIGTIVEMCLDIDGAYEVRCVMSGRDALNTARAWKPDVILLDFMMPEMDGPTTFGFLKKDSETAEIPVIFITAKSMQEDIAKLEALGAVGVISKPFDPTSLASDIRALLS